MDGKDGGVAENEDIPLGDELMLPSGLIWVAISRLKTAWDSIVSSVPSTFSSVHMIQSNRAKQTCKDFFKFTYSVADQFYLKPFSKQDSLLNPLNLISAWIYEFV